MHVASQFVLETRYSYARNSRMSDFYNLAFLALPIVLAVALDEVTDNQNFNNSVLVFTGICLVLSLQVLLAEYDIQVSQTFLLGIWLLASIALMWRLIRHPRFSLRRVFVGSIVGSGLVSAGFAVWLYPYFRFPSIRSGAPFSNANNDLAIYVVSGDNFLHAGFREFGRVVGYQAGILTNFEVAGSSSLVATVARMTGSQIWRSTNLSMLVLISMTTVGLYILMRRWNVPVWIALVASVWLMTTPFSRLPQQNYFLSQTISRVALVLAIIGIDLVLRNKTRAGSSLGTCALAIASWLSLVTYPAGSISSIAVLFGVLTSYFVASKFSAIANQISPIRYLIVGISLLLPLPLVLGRWDLIVSNVSLYSRANVTGWPASTTSLMDWLGISSISSTWLNFVLMLLSISLCIWCVLRIRRSIALGPATGLLVFMSIFSAYLLLALMLGSSTYQVWKFLATVQPIALCGLVTFIAGSLQSRRENSRHRLTLLTICVFIFLLSINVIGSSETFRAKTQIPSMALEEAKKHAFTRTPNLLIRLDPYLETMIAPVILNIHDAIYASDTYLGPASPDDPRCAISKSKNANSVNVAKGLYIGPIENCK